MKNIEYVYKNGLTWGFETLDDGWIGIYLQHEETHEWQPMIQAKDRNAALSYIQLRERVPFGVQFI